MVKHSILDRKIPGAEKQISNIIITGVNYYVNSPKNLIGIHILAEATTGPTKLIPMFYLIFTYFSSI
jgi:hypothetical protein